MERRRLYKELRQREIAAREKIAREQREAEQREKERLAQQKKERELRELEEQQRENEGKEKERKRIAELEDKAEKQREELYDYKFGEKINIASFKSLNIADVTQLRIGVFGPTGSGKSCFINTCERAVKLTDKCPAPEQNAGAEGRVVLEDYLGGDLFFTLVDTRGFFNYTRDEKNEFQDILLGRIKPGDTIRRNPEDPGVDICTDEVPFNERLHSIILVVKPNDPRLQEGTLKDYLNPVRQLLRPIGISPIAVVTHHDKLNSDQDREDALSAASAATGSSLSHTFFVANYCSERPHRNVETELQVFEILHFALMSAERYVKTAKQEMRIEDSLREAMASSNVEGPQVPLLVYEKRDKVNPGAAEAGRNRAKAENDQKLADLEKELKISEQNALRQAMLAAQIDHEFYIEEQKLKEKKFLLKCKWEEEERTRKLQKAEQSSLKLKGQLLEYTFGSRLEKDVFEKLDVSDMDKVRVALIGPTGSGKSCFIGTIERTLFGDRNQTNFAQGTGAEGTITLEEYLAWHDHIKLVDTRGFFDVNEATIQECLNIMTGRIRMGEMIYRDYDDNTAPVSHDRTAVRFGDQVHGVIFVVKANDPQLTNETYLERMKIFQDHFRFSGHSPVTVITYGDKVKSRKDREEAFAKASAATGSSCDRTFFISNYTDDKKEYSMETEKRAMEILVAVLYSAERFVKIHKLREFHHRAQGASDSATRKQPDTVQGSLSPSQNGKHMGYATVEFPPVMAHSATHASSSDPDYKENRILWEGTLQGGEPRTKYMQPGWELPQALGERLNKDNQKTSKARFKGEGCLKGQRFTEQEHTTKILSAKVPPAHTTTIAQDVKGLGDTQTPQEKASQAQAALEQEPRFNYVPPQTRPQKPSLAGAERDGEVKYDPLQGEITQRTHQKQQRPKSFSILSPDKTFKARSKGEGCLNSSVAHTTTIASEVFVHKPRPLPTDLELKKGLKGLGDTQTPQGRASLTKTTRSSQRTPQKPSLAGAETDREFKHDPLQGNLTYPTDQKQQKPQSFSSLSTDEISKARSKGEGIFKGQNVTKQQHTSQISSEKAPIATNTTITTHHVPAQLPSHTPPATKFDDSKNLQHRSDHSAATHETHQVPLGENEKGKAQLTPVNVAIIECKVSQKAVEMAHCFFYKIAKQMRLKRHLLPIQGTGPRQLVQKLLNYPNKPTFDFIVLLVDKAELTRITTRKEKISSYKDLLEQIQVNAATQAILIVCNDTDLIQGQLISESVTNVLKQVKEAGINVNEEHWFTLSWNEEDPSFSTDEYEMYLTKLVQIADARRETAPQPLLTTNQTSAQNHHSETKKQPDIVQGPLYPSHSGSHVGYGTGEFPSTVEHKAAHASSYNPEYKGNLILWEGTLEYGNPRTKYIHPDWKPPQSLCERLRKDNKDIRSAGFKVEQNADRSYRIYVDSIALRIGKTLLNALKWALS